MTNLANPTWTAPRDSADRSVIVTPCDPIEMRLLEVRIPWEPSSIVEDSDRKNVYFELKDTAIIEFLRHQENMLAEEGGLLNSCVAKHGLLMQNRRQAGVRLRQRQTHRRSAPQVRQLDVQRYREAHRQVANAGRQRVRTQPAGHRR